MKNLLVDTNIFLEIFLDQDKKDKCKQFLNNNIKNLFITDFSLHTIGLILLNNDKGEIFKKFIKDTLPQVTLISLPKDCYTELISNAKRFNLDFDDAYQTTIALIQEMKIVTMDKDFKKVEKELGIKFL